MKIIVRLVIFSLVFSLCSLPALSQVRAKAPNFSLRTFDGRKVELAGLKGKVVAVNFWATWCGPCRAEIAGFLEIYKEYQPKGLEIVGISLDDDGWTSVKPFAERFKISYPTVIGNARVAMDYGPISAIPTTFIVDKEGNIAKRHVGYLPKPLFEKLIKELL